MDSYSGPIRIPEAEQYSCPWCSKRSGFTYTDTNTIEGWFKGIGRAMATALVNPRRYFKSFFDFAILGDCLNCHRHVAICPHCDHPNRPIGLFQSCSNCGKDYTPGSRMTQFGTRHTASSQTDPVRGIGAATAWVTQQLQAIAATSNGNMTVQQQSFVQPVSNNIPVPTTITNVIATLQGTASPERFYVVTGHLDSRVTDVLDFTSDAPGADDDGSGVACVLELARRSPPSSSRAPSSSRPSPARSRDCTARPSWLSRWQPPVTTSRACSAMTSSGPARPSTAPGPTRSRCGCSWKASRLPRPRARSRSCSRSEARTTGCHANWAGSCARWHRPI